MDKCRECGYPIPPKFQNRRLCPSCVGKCGGHPKSPLKEKVARRNQAGYLYWTHTMLTDEERELAGNSRIVLIHRFLMAKHLGRPLLPGEVVMHKDGNRLNNELSNLELGDPLTNTRQHWIARQESEQWKRLATILVMTAKY